MTDHLMSDNGRKQTLAVEERAFIECKEQAATIESSGVNERGTEP